MSSPMAKKPKKTMHAEEIVRKILEILPVKTLLRFRVACKTWNTLITSPEFKEVHHQRRTTNPPLLLKVRHPDNGDPDLVLFNLLLSRYNMLEGIFVKTFSKNVIYAFGCDESNCIRSCRGLVCIASTLLDSIIICNPSTEELEHLPLSKGDIHCIGFGYEESSKKFKMVRIFRHSDRFCCDALTVGSGQWRKVSADPYHMDHHRWGLRGAPFLNGALHFLPLRPDTKQENDCISVFFVDTEVYRKVSLPDHCLKDYSERHLSVLGGSLCLTITFRYERQFAPPKELWILKNYHNDEWVKEYEILPFSGSELIDIVGIMEDEIILMNVSLTKGNELIHYRPESNSISRDLDKDCSATFFVESLFTPEGA